jgi:hypothetical protein
MRKTDPAVAEIVQLDDDVCRTHAALGRELTGARSAAGLAAEPL